MPTIFIADASSGLGKATAKLFAARGWHVIATMRHPEHETELTQLPTVHLLPLDVSDSAQVEATVQRALALRPVDVVFNNVNCALSDAIEAVSDEQITQLVSSNLLIVMRLTKAFLPYLQARQEGLILSTISIEGLVAPPIYSIYLATQWVIEAWNESMCFELAQHNIRIKTLSPGGMGTDSTGHSLQIAQHEAYAGLFQKSVAIKDDGGNTFEFAEAETIAYTVYEAAIDSKD